MCTVCGCSSGGAKVEGSGESVHPGKHRRFHVHGDGTVHSRNGGASHRQHHGQDIHYGLGPAHAHAPGMSQARMVKVEQDILAKNNQYASANRSYFAEHGIFALNLVSSPGSGKTTLLEKLIPQLTARGLKVSVIKHAHHGFDIDKPGKDSYRHFHAGAAASMTIW